MPPSPSALRVYRFGPFELRPSNRLLLERGSTVRIGGRALDLLIALVEHAGQFVGKEQLLRTVWPTTVVEETSLRVHVAALRRALRDGEADAPYIVSQPGLGYAFAAPLLSAPARGGAPPAGLRRAVLGREAALQSIESLLDRNRLVTITGEGGIGKTTVAGLLADRLGASFADGARLVDLSVITEPQPLLATMGRALGVTLPPDAPVGALAEAVSGWQMLLVLDNCEHLIERVAELVVRLLRAASGLKVLATSREPLFAEGEQLYRLEALPVPPAGLAHSAMEVMRFESVQLLVERAQDAVPGFALVDAEAASAAELCRRLDGMPLAIELAAARAGREGLAALLQRLPEQLMELSSEAVGSGRRHRTLGTLYDWSYRLLGPAAQRAFQCLSVFAGAFDLEAAQAVMPPAADGDRISAFLELVAKSLVSVESREAPQRYRLLETARAYAARSLRGSDDPNAPREAHARHLLRVLEAANPSWETGSRRAWLARHGPHIDDIQLALDWASSVEGDAVLFATLVSTSFQLAQQLSQLEPHRRRVELALDLLARRPERHVALERNLTAVLGTVMGHASAEGGLLRGWRARMADQPADLPPSPELLYGQVVVEFAHGQYRRAHDHACELEQVCTARGDDQGTVIAWRMQAQLLHFLGQHGRARVLAEDVMRHPAPALRLAGTRLDPVDRRISMRIVLARIAWLEGDGDAAEERVAESLALSDHDLDYARCQVLALAGVPIAIGLGQLDRARERLAQMRRLVERHAIAYWHDWTKAYEWLLDAGPPPSGAASAKLADHLATFRPRLVDEHALRRARSGEAGWCAAEILRGGAARLQAPEAARDLLVQARDLARGQGATRWELRANLDLAELATDTDERRAHAEAAAVCAARFRGPATCPDLGRAATLLRDAGTVARAHRP